MTRLLAIEWDEGEARVAVGSVARGRLVVEAAFGMPLAGGGAPLDAAALGQRIGERLAAERLGRVQTLVAVGRPSIELRDLTLPPSPPEDWPDLARFQAQREFHTFGEDWALDFIPQPGEEGQSVNVLAAAISPELVAETRATCTAAGLEPTRLVLRPCAAAALLCRQQAAPAGQLRLLVDLLADQVDLTALVDETPVLLRTARLPADATQPEHARALIGEIRRTLAAVHNRLKGQRVEVVHLCGDREHQSALVEQIQRDLGLEAQLFEPFGGLNVADALARRLPEHPSRFAPVLGMLVAESLSEPPAIDFLNPRRRPAPPNRRRELSLAAAVAAVLLLLLVGYTWWSLGNLDDEIVELQKQSTDLDKSVKKAADAMKATADIDAWAASDLVWLDELRQLAERLPPAADLMLTDLRIGAQREGGQVQMEGVVRSPDIIDAVDRSVRDERHRIEIHSTHQDAKQERYGWRFKSDIAVDREDAGPASPPQTARSRP